MKESVLIRGRCKNAEAEKYASFWLAEMIKEVS